MIFRYLLRQRQPRHVVDAVAAAFAFFAVFFSPRRHADAGA